eukprot:s8855_g1.t1
MAAAPAPPAVAEMRKYVGELLLQRGRLGPVGDYKAQVLLQMAQYGDAVMRRVINDVHAFSGATDKADLETISDGELESDAPGCFVINGLLGYDQVQYLLWADLQRLFGL